MATISQKEWKQYIARLQKINDKAVEEFKQIVIDRGGYAQMERQKLIDIAYGITTKYGEASAALSASMYDAVAELSGAAVPAALPAETATYSEVAKTVNGIIKNTESQDIMAQGVGRLVKMAGTDTILSNAHRDGPNGKGSKRKHSGAQVAWIPSGDTCPFCLMLASKGWVNQTQWAANNHSEHIHANCDCTYMVRFDDNLDVAGYDPDEYKAIYDNAEGKTRDEKFRSMQRQYRAENKDKINAQKRANYAEKKARKSGQDTKESAKNPILLFEKKHYKDNTESGLLIRSDGKSVELGGIDNHVIGDVSVLKEMENGTFTHNHPLDVTFSNTDIKNGIVAGNLRELRAITSGGNIHILVNNGASLEERRKFNAYYDEARRKFERIANDKVRRGEIKSREEYIEQRKEKWLEENAPKYGLEYSKKKIVD